MAKNEIQNGQAEYGVVHVMEEEMRAAAQGVYEPRSGEPRRRRKSDAPVENKMEAAPSNKSTASKVISAATAPLRKAARK